MSKNIKARITGMGTYLPEKILANSDFERMTDTTDEWIVTRTGIQERRIAGTNESTSDMGAAAAREALANAGVDLKDVDFVLTATLSPDYTSSSAAAIIQSKLGLSQVGAADIQAACTGFLYALSMAKAFVESGTYRTVLVVAAEKMSAYVDYEDRYTSVLFGDGAAAAVVCASGEGLAIDALSLGSNGALAELVYVPAGGSRQPTTGETVATRMHYFKMQGKEVFKQAVRCMQSAAQECLTKLNLTDEQISWVIPHQANLRIMEAVTKGFEIPVERMYKTVHKYGNTSASSIPIALHELTCAHQLAEGERLLLVAFGAGLTWGAAILTKVMK